MLLNAYFSHTERACSQLLTKRPYYKIHHTRLISPNLSTILTKLKHKGPIIYDNKCEIVLYAQNLIENYELFSFHSGGNPPLYLKSLLFVFPRLEEEEDEVTSMEYC
jgi:hypothetical protein